MPAHLRLPEPRPLDSRRPQGGGPSETRTPPVPSAHGGQLKKEFGAATSATPRVVVEGVDPRRVFKVRATTRLNVGPRGLVFLGDTTDWTYFVMPSDEAGAVFGDQLDHYELGDASKVVMDFFSNVEEIEPYGPVDRRGPGVPEPGVAGEWLLDVLVWPSGDDAEANGRLANVVTIVEHFGGSVVTTDRRPSTTMARVRVDEHALEALLDAMVVERIRAPLTPYLEPSDWFHATTDVLVAADPIDVIVGVIDDGVHTGHPLLVDVVGAELAIPDTHPWAEPTTHGTMVAGLAAYGDFDDVLSEGSTFPAPARLAIARVLEPVGPNERTTRFPTEIPEHVVVEEAIRALHAQGARIINLSITDPHAYSGPHASLWTEVLDRLVRELDIVVVVAAGNRAIAASGEIGPGVNVHTSYPTYLLDAEARIAEPAVGANVIAVGSIARSGASARHDGTSHAQDIAIAQPNEVSPFSRTGPGMNGVYQLGAVKPEFVHYGGNLVWTGIGRINDMDAGAGTVSTALTNTGRHFAVGSGTSFAAPRIARTAAEIAYQYPDASANLIRALLGISARVPEAAAAQFSDVSEQHRAFGYGVPDSRRASESDGNRVVLTYQGDIDVDTAIIHPIPIPPPFATGKADRTITVSLAYDPPVRRQRREYTAGHLGIDFYRAMSLEDVAAIVRRQEGDDKEPLPEDRRRIADRLRPGAHTSGASTLQVRRWHAPSANSLLPDDGDTYFLVIKHFAHDWAKRLAEPYESQRYALAVELDDRTRVDVNLYATLEAQVRDLEQARLHLTR